MEILETYIKQIGKYPLLNAEQEKKLSEQIEKGSAAFLKIRQQKTCLPANML